VRRTRNPDIDTYKELNMDREPDRKQLKKVPAFATRDEEIKFWETHDSSEYQLGGNVKVTVAPGARKHRCQCGQLATIKTAFNRDGVAYHCSEGCRQWWMRTSHPASLGDVEKKPEGWPKQ
jgi:hypothetical protein